MHPFKTIGKYLKRKIFDPMENIDLAKVAGWHSMGGTYNAYKRNDMENGYASIRVIADNFALAEPYTIDSNGKPVPSNVLDRIYFPNNQMSAYDFREALAVMALVHNKVHIRVHYAGTRINADSIRGFTFIEDSYQQVVDGKYTYRLTNGELLTDDEVITLKNINPYDLNQGFSPANAARRWTALDDYIADYQRGFFENGAVPAGEFIITARTASEFNDIVDNMMSKHKGAGANNNVTYSHRPTDQYGSTMNSQIEWVPFSSTNKDMALKDLFENVNKKIDSVYGVPASLRAVNDQNTYASVRTDEVVFMKYRLDPFTLKIWSKFTHELNRITGGIGVAISYDLEIPQIADEEKVKSEARSVDASTISLLSTAGFSLDTIVDAFEYPESYKLLRTDAKKPVIVNDKPEVLVGDQATGTPDQPKHEYGKQVKPKQMTEVDRQVYIDRMSTVIKSQMTSQVDKAANNLKQNTKDFGDTTADEDMQFSKAMLDTLLPLTAVYGNRTVDLGLNLILQAGLSTQAVQPFQFTDDQIKGYRNYLAKVGRGYADQTAEQIRGILAQSIEEGLSRQQIEAQLREVILGSENEYRVTRLARTEVNLSEGRASVSAMENIQRETGYSIYKVWNVASSNPCEFCLSLEGTETLVDSNFVDQGDDIHGIDGGIYHNDFSDTDTAEAHPNCSCYTTYKVERD